MIAGAVAASMARRRQQQRQRQKEQQRRREQQRKREQARRLQLRNRQRQEEQQQRNNHNHNHNHNPRMSLTSSFLDPDEIEAFVQEYNARRYSLANLEDEVEFLEQINALEVDFLRMFDATHPSSSEEEDEEQEEAAYVQDRYNDFSFDIPTATVVATAEIVAEGHGGEEVVGEHIVQATEVVEQGQGHDYGTDYSPVPVTLPIIRGHKSSVCAIQ